jgi:hypothetical protein
MFGTKFFIDNPSITLAMGFFGFGKKKEKKGGWVYVAESTRKNGEKKLYVGKTTRTPYERWGEHIASVKAPKKSSWVSKGTHVKPIGAVWSSNPSKAEKTIKTMTPTRKRNFGRYGASRYRKNRC